MSVVEVAGIEPATPNGLQLFDIDIKVVHVIISRLSKYF